MDELQSCTSSQEKSYLIISIVSYFVASSFEFVQNFYKLLLLLLARFSLCCLFFFCIPITNTTFMIGIFSLLCEKIISCLTIYITSLIITMNTSTVQTPLLPLYFPSQKYCKFTLRVLPCCVVASRGMNETYLFTIELLHGTSRTTI